MPDDQDSPSPAAAGLALAELLCTRLCHDFSGPLGAVIAAAELLGEDGIDQDETRATLLESARALARRLRFLRAAWGGGGGSVMPADLADLAEGVVGGGRVHVDLASLAPDAVFGPGLARTLLSAILLAGEALPKGGVVRVLADPASGSMLLLPDGPGAAWPDGTAAALAGGPAGPPSARTLLAPLTVAIAGAAGLTLRLALASGGLPPMLVIGGRPVAAQGGHAARPSAD